ncbi:MAG TPA: DEAD/DEAH box helicase [Candidatus Brocadiaceae bacterium]
MKITTDEKVLRFENLTISKDVRKAIESLGFEEATPIQAQAIPYILEGRDVIGQAQTGTGKTAAFGIPALDMLDAENRKLQAVVLCPTRELAIQVAEELKKLAKYKKDTEILPIYGGQAIDRQIRVLKKGVQIIVGTPGRVIDHLERQTLKMDKVKMVVLDEADEMLDMGFREDIELILKKIPKQRQIVLFSATMPKAILDLAHKYQNNPQIVKVVHKELTVPSVEQFYFELNESSKPDILSRLMDIYNLKSSLVFCNTKRRVDKLVEDMQTRGYLADGLHGDLKQMQRDNVMSKFRKGTIEMLVATDVAARGIDVENVEAVFNYDVPLDEEQYVHRIGRTGRAGKTGRAFTFVVGRDIYQIKDIQRYTKAKITPQKVPTVHDVKEIRTDLMLQKVKDVIQAGHMGKYVHWIEELLEENYTALDVAASLLKIVMGDEENEKQFQDEKSSRGAKTSEDMDRLFINIGRKEKINPKDILASIAENTGISGKLIGAIDIYDKFTFVDVSSKHSEEIQNAMEDVKIKGKRISVEPANKKSEEF